MNADARQLPIEDVKSIACRVLETATFSFAETTDVLPDADFGIGDAASIYLGSETTATLTIAAPRLLSIRLAADLLALGEEEIESAQCGQLLAELANMIAGHAATACFGEANHAHLGTPQVHVITNEDFLPMASTSTTTVLVSDDLPFLVDWHIESNSFST